MERLSAFSYLYRVVLCFFNIINCFLKKTFVVILKSYFVISHSLSRLHYMNVYDNIIVYDTCE